MPTYRNIVVLTGAGLSAESGIATFRDKDGIWSRFDIEDVATPDSAESPAPVRTTMLRYVGIAPLLL